MRLLSKSEERKAVVDLKVWLAQADGAGEQSRSRVCPEAIALKVDLWSLSTCRGRFPLKLQARCRLLSSHTASPQSMAHGCRKGSCDPRELENQEQPETKASLQPVCIGRSDGYHLRTTY